MAHLSYQLAEMACWRRAALESQDTASGAARVKAWRSIKRKGLSAIDNVRALDKMLQVSLGFGLEMYAPKHRLLPGKPLVLNPPNAALRPMLLLVPDELKTGLQSSYYLWSLGLRGATGRDPHHRAWNDVRRACERAGLWSSMARRTVVFCVLRAFARLSRSLLDFLKHSWVCVFSVACATNEMSSVA